MAADLVGLVSGIQYPVSAPHDSAWASKHQRISKSIANQNYIK